MSVKPCATCLHHRELYGQGVCLRGGKATIATLVRRMGGCGSAGAWHVQK